MGWGWESLDILEHEKQGEEKWEMKHFEASSWRTVTH